MENTQTTRRYTPEEYETVAERVEIKVEYLDEQIVPKEGLAPLPDWVVDELLKPNFNQTILNYEFPMSTFKHDKIIMNLVFEFFNTLDREKCSVFGQAPKIYISLAGRYRIPDVCITPAEHEIIFEEDKVTNPTVVMEILSPSNRGEDFMEKIEDYKSVESLKEYWLVSQDKQHLERFVRIDAKRWENRTYNQEDEEIEFPSLGITLKAKDIYKGVIFKNNKK